MTEQPHPPDPTLAVAAEHTRLVLPSHPDWLGPTVEFLKHKAVLTGACQPSRSSRLVVALHEALSNAIIHGNLEVPSELREQDDRVFAELLARRAADPAYGQRVVEVCVDYDGHCCRWTLTDQGPGFDVERVLARLEAEDPGALASGRGILLMRSFMDEVRYDNGGRTVVLVLRPEPGGEPRQHPRGASTAHPHGAPVRPDGRIDWEAAHQTAARALSSDGLAGLQGRLTGVDRVLLGLGDGPRPVFLPAEVSHWRHLPGSRMELGCQFRVPGGADAAADAAGEVNHVIDRVLGQRAADDASDDERRAAPRTLFTERVCVLTGPGHPPLTGYPRDLSRGGVSFLTTRPLGGELTILFPPGAGGVPLGLRALVVRCARVQEGYYDVGARFAGAAVDAPAGCDCPPVACRHELGELPRCPRTNR